MTKVYLISTPEQLKAAAPSVKWGTELRKMLDFAATWSDFLHKQPHEPFPFKVTLELGRQAIIFREKDGSQSPIATLILNGAREYAKGLMKV